MTTETSDHIPVINKYEEQQSERFDEFQMEKQRFNTGPCASKTLPAQFVSFDPNIFDVYK
jgi:hypothetical protein